MLGRLSSAAEQARVFVQLLRGGQMDLGSLSAALAELYQDRPAAWSLSHEDPLTPSASWTFAQLEHSVARLAAAHQARGHTEGCHVVLLLPNHFTLFLHMLALCRAGAVAVPVNAHLKPSELSAIIEASRAEAVVAASSCAAPFAEQDETHALRWCALDDEAPIPWAQGESLHAWLDAHPCVSLAPQTRDPQETTMLLCTSGTTGRPKAAALTSHGLLAAMGPLFAAPLGFRRGPAGRRDAVLIGLPLTHVMGISACLAALCSGVLLLQFDRFRASQALQAIEHHQPNAFVGVPTMYADLESEGASSSQLSSVQLWVSGADVMPPDRAQRFQRYGAAMRPFGRPTGLAGFADVYGMVELSGPMALRWYPLSPSRRLPLPTVAITLPGFETRAIDEDGHVLGFGQVGQLQVRGDAVLQRYEGNEKAGPDTDGWFSTGDFVRLWPGGFFSFAGRRRDRIKVGGFSVFPAEVETSLREHPNVQEIALVGIPDERLGEKPVALVIPHHQPFEKEPFLEWASKVVAGYRRPRDVAIVTTIPRGAHGKINRQAASQQALEIFSASY